MADVSKTVSIVFQGKDEASATVSKINTELGKIDGSASASAKSVGELNAEVTKLGDVNLSKVTDSFKALAAGIVVKEFIDANIAAEKFNLAMKTVTGTNEGAAAAFEYVRGVANRLGVGVQETATAFSRFAAATKGTALEGEQAAFIFESFSKAVIATGGNTTDLSGAFTQLSQGISKGRFELEDLKSIAERVPGFFDQFARSLGVSTEELFKLISAGKIGGAEISKFAQTLNESFKNVEIDTFEAALNRFRNTLDEVYVQVGKSGAFDALTKGIELGSAAVIGAIAAFKLLGEIAGNVAFSLSTEKFGFFSEGFAKRLDESLQKAGASTTEIRDRLFKLRDEATPALAAVAGGIDKIPQAAESGKNATKDLNAALKDLGLDPNQFIDPIEKVTQAFRKLVDDPKATGEQILAGLLVTLDKINKNQVPEFIVLTEKAFDEGKITAQQYTVAIEALSQKEEGLLDTIIRTNKSTQDQEKALADAAKEAKRAQEQAEKLALEYEKIASNERIKLIEFNFKLNAEEIKAETERIKLSFDSLAKGIDSTASVINSALGALGGAGGFYGLEKLKIIEEQLAKENAFRKDQFDLQKSLVEEQIKRLKAQTESIERGDALIRIDGSGLAPQLEAFMWEVLRSIQVRVTKDGLPLLLGI